MLLDEARLAARIQHPNVVPTIDVVMHQDQILLVMEYVRGDSLSRLIRAAQLDGLVLPANVVVAILLNALAGLHAAHEATDERGQPLELVHRDVSPQNILVGLDGVARVLDFGIAKAEGRLQSTKEGEVKGKVMYMSKEQLAAEVVTRSSDIYAVGIILFEALTCTRMFSGEGEMTAITRIIANDLEACRARSTASLAPFDAIVQREGRCRDAPPIATRPPAKWRSRSKRRAYPPRRRRSAIGCRSSSATRCRSARGSSPTSSARRRARARRSRRRSSSRRRCRIRRHTRAFTACIQASAAAGRRCTRLFTGPIQVPGSMVPMSEFPSAPPYASMPLAGRRNHCRQKSNALLVLIALIGFLILGSIGAAGIVLSRRKPVVEAASATSASAAPPVKLVVSVSTVRFARRPPADLIAWSPRRRLYVQRSPRRPAVTTAAPHPCRRLPAGRSRSAIRPSTWITKGTSTSIRSACDASDARSTRGWPRRSRLPRARARRSRSEDVPRRGRRRAEAAATTASSPTRKKTVPDVRGEVVRQRRSRSSASSGSTEVEKDISDRVLFRVKDGAGKRASST